MGFKQQRGGHGSSSRGSYNKGPKLPAALLETLGESSQPTRKHRDERFNRPQQQRQTQRPQGSFRRDGRDQESAPPIRKSTQNSSVQTAPEPRKEGSTKRKALPERSTQAKEEPPKKKKKKPELRLPALAKGDAEDDEIQWLEYMLKKEKGKKAQDEFEDDGLDDILDFADFIGPGGKGLPGGMESDDDGDGDEDVDSVGDEDEGSSEDEDDGLDALLAGGDSDSEGEDDEDGDEDSEEILDEDEEYAKNPDDSSEEGNLDGGDLGIDKDTPGTTQAAKRTDTTDQVVEPSSEAAPTRYIPPHLRAAQLKAKADGDQVKQEEKRKLERKAQGCLNKLSEANMDSILGEIETLYRDHSRNDVTSIITDLIILMISNKSNLLDSFVTLYATLVGAIYKTTGTEFGAHFIHTVITRYYQTLNNPSGNTLLPATIYETPDISKESLNLLTLVAELYNAKVIGSTLIYDFVRGFVDSLEAGEGGGGGIGERETESLLKIVKICGPQLRNDDPGSLKDIVQLMQDKIKGKEGKMSTRARFMVETLVNLKNGKKGQHTDSGEVSRMKKYLTGLGRKRRVLASEPLRISLSDLLSADTRGKWWIVGAGWSGNPLVEEPFQEALRAKHQESKEGKEVGEGDEDILGLARRQGMNTDIRRTVFTTIMTSEDFMHACDRLSQLRFTEAQQREFIRVAFHCCTVEKTYNPFYTLILNNLCGESYSHRFTLQYTLWDFIRALEEPLESGEEKVMAMKRGNVARGIAYIVARGSIDLTVLKAIEFTTTKSPTRSFLSTFLAHLILSTQTLSPLFTLPKKFKSIDYEPLDEVFQKALVHGELSQGLLYIVNKEIKVNGGSGNGCLGMEESQVKVVKMGLKRAKGILGSAV